jgi:hypothetical protein
MGNGTVFDKTERFSFFHDFYTILHFNEFCKTHYFEILNSVLTKILKYTLVFLDFFILKNSN